MTGVQTCALPISNGAMKIAVSDKIDNEFILNLQAVLTEATGLKWTIEPRSGALGETLADKEAAKDRENKKDVMELPLVKAILKEFPRARIDSLTHHVIKEDIEPSSSTFFEEDTTFIDEDN